MTVFQNLTFTLRLHAQYEYMNIALLRKSNHRAHVNKLIPIINLYKLHWNAQLFTFRHRAALFANLVIPQSTFYILFAKTRLTRS